MLAARYIDDYIEVDQPKFSLTQIQLEAVKMCAAVKHSCFYGGAGSGKTFLIVRLLIARAMSYKSDHLILRKTLASALVSICDQAIPNVLKTCFPDLKLGVNVKFNISKSYFTFPNGSKIYIGGTEDKAKLDKLLGPEWSTIYINEASEVPQNAFEIAKTRLRQPSGLKFKFFVDCNPVFKSHWTYQTFVLKVDKFKMSLNDAWDYDCIQMNPSQNSHLAADFVESLKNMPSKMKKRFYDGEFADDAEGALWSQKDIDNNRVPFKNYKELFKVVPMAQVVVGVDPAMSSTENSDLTGIVAVSSARKLGKDNREELYVLADRSCREKPLGWAKQAIQLYNDVNADLIICESNQGGELVYSNLRAAGFLGKIEMVHASKGKITRAEPWQALYEQGYVHHLNSNEFIELEQEMTTYVEYMLSGKDASPDRMDAMVWAGTYLISNNNHAKFARQFDPAKFKAAQDKYFGKH